MVEITEENINKIINLKGADGELIDIFNLHGVLFVGNTQDGMWDLSKTYTRYSEHSLYIDIHAFGLCESEDDILEIFHEEFEKIIQEKLL
jgi:hypothetical protein